MESPYSFVSSLRWVDAYDGGTVKMRDAWVIIAYAYRIRAITNERRFMKKLLKKATGLTEF